MEKNPARITRMAVKRGSRELKSELSGRATSPMEIIIGKVPIQKTNIIRNPVRGSALAIARARKLYSQPQGRNVVTKPIRKGAARLLDSSDGLAAILTRFPGVCESRLSNLWPLPVSCRMPLMIRSMPAIKAEILPSCEALFSNDPVVAARRPKLVYVNSLPRL